MKLSEVNPLEPLKELLLSAGLDEQIYVGKAPTANLPNSYVVLYQNGGLNSNMSKLGIIRGVVLISVNVKLLSNGQRNLTKHKVILNKFDELFAENQSQEKDGYTYSLNLDSMVYQGGGIKEGYTTELINLNFNKQ